MGVRFDEVRVEIDYTADFGGRKTIKFAVPLTIDTQDDNLLRIALVRKAQLDAAVLANAPPPTDPFPMG